MKTFEEYKSFKRIQSEKGIETSSHRKILRPILRIILYVQRALNGFHVQCLNSIELNKNEPVIIAVTHIGKWDFEIVNEQIKEPFWILAADYIHMNKGFNKLFLHANGIVFVDETDRLDKKVTKQILIKLIEQGQNIMMFPEGTWNISENELIYDIAFGTADIAIQTNRKVLPIAVEQYGKNFVIKAGEKLDFKHCNKMEATMQLRDSLATLRWEIWENHGIERRTMLNSDYWKNFVQSRRDEWSGYSVSEQIVNTYIPQYKIDYLQVQRMLKPDGIPLRFQLQEEEK